MTLTYCPECAAPLTKKTDTTYVCTQGHYYWNNAKASVAVVFAKDGQLLVSKRGVQADPNYGKYDLPGGFVDFGETAYDAALREVQEELGIQLLRKDLQLLEVYSNRYDIGISTIDLVFLASEWQDDFILNNEVQSVEWKPYAFINDPLFCEPYDGLDTLLEERNKVQ